MTRSSAARVEEPSPQELLEERIEITPQEALVDLLARSVDDPAFFIENVLQPELGPQWKWQKRVCEKIRKKLERGERHIKVLIRSCHGAGKTWLAAALTLWWAITRHKARVLTLAPTWSGVEDHIWPNIATLFAGSLVREWGKMLDTSLELDEPLSGGKSQWYAIGASSDRPEHLEGHHSPTAAMRVVDEAKAVDLAIFIATEGMLDAPETLDLWISTPSVEYGAFYDRDLGTEDVVRYVVDVDELIADGVEGKLEWKLDLLKRWGATDPEFQSRVMALYVANIAMAMFPSSWVERAIAQEFDVPKPLKLGMDVAGSDDGDENAVAIVGGPDFQDRVHIRSLAAWNERDTMISKGKAIAIELELPGKVPYTVDAAGLGKGVVDSLRQDGHSVSEYWAGSEPREPARFLNVKAEDNWYVRTLLEEGLIRILTPTHPLAQKLKSQFRSIKYKVMQSGKTQILKPSDSPDLVDAIVIACSVARRKHGFIPEETRAAQRPLTVRDMRAFG